MPVRDFRHGLADEVAQAGMALFVHPLRQARNHFLHHLEAISHGGGTDLHIARTQRHELGRIAPRCHAANATDRQAGRFRVAGNVGHHIHGNWLDCRSAISAMRAHAVDGWLRRHDIQVDRGDRVDRVDQADRIGTATHGGLGRAEDIGDVRRQLDDAGALIVLFHPAGDLLHIFGHLAHGAPHAAFGHAMRAAEIQLHPISIGGFDLFQNLLPGGFVIGYHQ